MPKRSHRWKRRTGAANYFDYSMGRTLTDFLDAVNSYVWSNALIYLCLAAGVYFSVRSKFVQVRQFREMIRLISRARSRRRVCRHFRR